MGRWREQARIGVSVGRAPCGRQDAELPPQVEEAFFRVAQEALANVARHSRATSVHIELRTVGDAAELYVRDNGAGFDTGVPSLGVGLRSMYERVAEVGGELRVESSGGGTLVAACVPLVEAGGDGR